jgi:hypothetical protein
VCKDASDNYFETAIVDFRKALSASPNQSATVSLVSGLIRIAQGLEQPSRELAAFEARLPPAR